MSNKGGMARVVRRYSTSKSEEPSPKSPPYSSAKRHRISRSLSGERRIMARSPHRQTKHRKRLQNVQTSNYVRKSGRDKDGCSKRRSPSPRHPRRENSSRTPRRFRDAPRSAQFSKNREWYTKVRDDRPGRHKGTCHSDNRVYIRAPPVAMVRASLPRPRIIPNSGIPRVRLPCLPHMIRPIMRPVLEVTPLVMLRPLRPPVRPIGRPLGVFQKRYIL